MVESLLGNFLTPVDAKMRSTAPAFEEQGGETKQIMARTTFQGPQPTPEDPRGSWVDTVGHSGEGWKGRGMGFQAGAKTVQVRAPGRWND